MKRIRPKSPIFVLSVLLTSGMVLPSFSNAAAIKRLFLNSCARALKVGRMNSEPPVSAEEIISLLDLKPLPGEGGFFRETYRASQMVQTSSGADLKQIRHASTSIYYLITPETFSALHRLPHDEVFHFYTGHPVQMLLISSDGSYQIVTLGPNIKSGQVPQFLVPAGTWQGTRLDSRSDGFALLGTSVAPAFEFTDLEMGNRARLMEEFSNISSLIEMYTVEN